jgi:hypothetical protein
MRRVVRLQQRTQQTTTQVIQAALEQYVGSEETPANSLASALEASGFIGSGEGSPDDSSRYKTLLADSLRKKGAR